MNRYNLTEQAQADISAITEYIANEATVEHAMRVLVELRDAFRMLGEMPGIGHYREDLLDQRYRFWTVRSYVIVYRWEITPV
jgi:plasmid stabilization system protein ParE